MRKGIEAEFRRQTIISVLHRFNFVDRYDRVVVLKHGKLVESDSPIAVLGKESIFRELYNAHSFELLAYK
jgi:ATP-binding cassette, subfamily C (CFTR/MRP), member 1